MRSNNEAAWYDWDGADAVDLCGVINSLAAWQDTCTKNCQMVQILGVEPVMMFLHKRGEV